MTLIPTMHHGHAVIAAKKPEIIMTYNCAKDIVDTFDKLCQYVYRKTRRSLSLFQYAKYCIYQCMQYAIYCHSYYRNNSGKALSRLQFMIKLRKELCVDWQMKRLKQPNFSHELRKSIHKALEFHNRGKDILIYPISSIFRL